MTLRTSCAALVFLSAMLNVACSTGKNGEMYQELDFRLFNGESRDASFTLDMSDSSCVYEVSLISRLTRKDIQDSVTFAVTITSPSGLQAGETVTFPSDYHALRSGAADSDDRISTAWSTGHYDVSWLYRDNIEPVEYGEWQLTLSAVDTAESMIGAGISIKRIPKVR